MEKWLRRLGWGSVVAAAAYLWANKQQRDELWKLVADLWSRGLLMYALVAVFMVAMLVLVANGSRLEHKGTRRKEMLGTWGAVVDEFHDLTPHTGAKVPGLHKLSDLLTAHGKALRANLEVDGNV